MPKWGFFVIAYLVLSGIDLATTLVGLRVGSGEANPFAAYFYVIGGPLGITIWKVIGVSCITVTSVQLWDRLGMRLIAWTGLGLLVGTCINNIKVVSSYV